LGYDFLTPNEYTSKQWLTLPTGQVIAKQLFPEHAAVLNPSTWALTCMLHDIGTAEAYFRSTRMSFDIYGGFLALETLKKLGSADDQAEAVAEAIVRHQDVSLSLIPSRVRNNH
jgi:cyanamide hydratase